MTAEPSEASVLKESAERPPLDRLLHIADLHFWRIEWNPLHLLNKRFLGNLNVLLRRRHEFPMERAESFLDAVCATGVSTALLTGDFTSTATEAEFARARRFVDSLGSRGMTMHLLPGNHDVYTFEASRKGWFERYFGEYLPEGGYPACLRLPGGTPMVLVPTVCPNWVSSRGRIGAGAVDIAARYLAGHASAKDAKCVVVGGHYPVLNETYGYSVSSGRRLAGGDALRRAMGTCGIPVLYVSGHVHRFSFVQDFEYPSLHHLSTGAFFRLNRREAIEGEFAEVHVSARGFGVFRHILGKEWRRELIEPRRS